jgi:hypothetical protein
MSKALVKTGLVFGVLIATAAFLAVGYSASSRKSTQAYAQQHYVAPATQTAGEAAKTGATWWGGSKAKVASWFASKEKYIAPVPAPVSAVASPAVARPAHAAAAPKPARPAVAAVARRDADANPVAPVTPVVTAAAVPASVPVLAAAPVPGVAVVRASAAHKVAAVQAKPKEQKAASAQPAEESTPELDNLVNSLNTVLKK